jgi:CopG family transcriptional regulator, nickel-responsive regulator
LAAMHRITITLDDDLIGPFEAFLKKNGYSNRSEGVRDVLRERLARIEPEQVPTDDCFATLTYVYDHHQRNLASRLTEMSHEHHDLTVSTLHLHLDHDHCLETAVLHGSVARIQAFSDSVISQPGVHHGKLYMLPVETSTQTHKHGKTDKPHRHVHVAPAL